MWKMAFRVAAYALRMVRNSVSVVKADFPTSRFNFEKESECNSNDKTAALKVALALVVAEGIAPAPCVAANGNLKSGRADCL